MPYHPDHKVQTRRKIVRAARRLFNRHGYGGVSIDQIMADADLTRGGFYAHFSSKDELYAEAVTLVLEEHPINDWEGVDIDFQSKDMAWQVVNAYLSQQHFDDVDGSCPMVAQPTDVARGSDLVKQAFTQVFEALTGGFDAHLTENNGDEGKRALAVATLCVGGMVIARAVGKDPLAADVREAARQFAIELGGWEVSS